MKNAVITFALALAACGLAFGVFYTVNCEPAEMRRAAQEGDAMAWLRVEFRLNDAQFAAIQKLHEDYRGRCADHCAAIRAAQQRQAPAADVAALEAACVKSTTEHFRRVAALMPAGQGERYLGIVVPRLADFDHRGAPTVQVRP